jgi:hypothetical protein
MRLKLFLPGLAAALAIAYPAGAVLKHYTVSWSTISEFNSANPQLNKYPGGKGGAQDTSQAIVDNTASPVLKRLLLVSETELTVQALSGFIFLSSVTDQGPRKGLSFTGTGSTATTIAWGLVTGWTVTGGFWCNSSPTYICGLADGILLVTAESPFNSPSYDLGTWTFHGTGFTSVPYVNQIQSPGSESIGNAQYHLKGRLSAGLVPAIPVLGVALLGASLLFAGARLSRKR